MDRQQQAAARQLMAHAQTLGLQLPEPISEAYSKMGKIRAGMGAIPPHNLTGVATAVAAALGRGTDPTTDPEVARAIALDAITMPSVADHVEWAAVMGLWSACSALQDDIVAELRKPFDQAAAVLVVAHERIGDLDLKADSEAILKKGGDIAKVWAGAVEAVRRIDDVVLTWVTLGRFIATNESVDRRWLNLRIVSPTADVWDELDLSRQTLGPWDAVRAGLALSLPTLSEYTQRRAEITERRAELEAAANATPRMPSLL